MELIHIIIGKKAKEELHYVNNVYAIESRGLEGDRYFFKDGTFNKPQLNQNVREISIFAFESLKECNDRLNSNLDFKDFRRNLIIKNFDVEKLKDKEFTIGNAKFKIIRTAPPCRYLSKLLDVDIMKGLKYIGGYRATVIKSGTIEVGNKIIPISSKYLTALYSSAHTIHELNSTPSFCISWTFSLMIISFCTV